MQPSIMDKQNEPKNLMLLLDMKTQLAIAEILQPTTDGSN